MSEIHEECGIFGVFAPTTSDVAWDTYYGLYALQHRGQESCGITVGHNGLFTADKDEGLVNEVFTSPRLQRLGKGEMAVGHVRYGTTGGGGRLNAQPIVVNHIKGHMALAHNGNLVNALELRSELEMAGAIFHTTSDTEVISYMITQARLQTESIETAIERAMSRIEGAYSLVVMSPQKLMAVRDPRGFRPLCYGQKADGTYIIASESCALDAVGAAFIRDIRPGEIVVFSAEGVRSITTWCDHMPSALCVFEYIYFARPDSVIDGVSVHNCRVKAGAFLADSHPVDADVVIGVPDSGLDAAIGFSRRSGIPYEIGFIKNKYIGRTFISPEQSARADGVRIKLNPIASVVRDKRVVLIDDSIVRGTTSAHIVRLLFEAGAREVHMRISSPPFLHPCYYGTDVDSTDHLIACHHTAEEIADIIGATSLGYLSVEQAQSLAAGGLCSHFCTACFDGKYPMAVPTDTRKDRFEQQLY